jgi:hypothetical protein
MTLRILKWLTEQVEFIERHRQSPSSFIRMRKLPFRTVLFLILRKSVKPLQLLLNEWTEHLDYHITASALSQARRKFKHTAFIELHKLCIVKVMYRGGDYEKFHGKRLLALDCTSLRLPNTKELGEEFGVVSNVSRSKQVSTTQVEAKASILYDLLNNIPVSASLFPGRTNDVKTVAEHIDNLKKEDLLLADRGYGSYGIFASVLARKADFLIRCKEDYYRDIHGLHKDDELLETVVELPCTKAFRSNKNFPASIRVRFIKILLDTGETEILASSLLDQELFPYSYFKDLYHKRWGIETYFQTLKCRLSIDNFTGKSLESVLQDFYATIFISGLEAIITGEANEELAEKNTRHPQKVNKAISFHVIKQKVLKLIDDRPKDFEEQVTKLFMQNPTLIRTERQKPPRKKNKASRNTTSLHFQKHVRKHVF